MRAGFLVESSEFFVENLVEEGLAGLLEVSVFVGCHGCAAD
jgi:hypothetical protein